MLCRRRSCPGPLTEYRLATEHVRQIETKLTKNKKGKKEESNIGTSLFAYRSLNPVWTGRLLVRVEEGLREASDANRRRSRSGRRRRRRRRRGDGRRGADDTGEVTFTAVCAAKLDSLITTYLAQV